MLNHRKKTGRAANEFTAIAKNGVVKTKPDAAENLRDFLKNIYWVEKALAKMAKNTTCTQLDKAFEDHLKET